MKQKLLLSVWKYYYDVRNEIICWYADFIVSLDYNEDDLIKRVLTFTWIIWVLCSNKIKELVYVCYQIYNPNYTLLI